MYLHIGNNNVINSKNIIGIFNIETIKKTDEYKKIIKKIKEKNNLNNISENTEKTLVLTEQEKHTKAYITNISSITLGKRMLDVNYM
jgi:ABC-type lipoprotein release transport system permease subunit